MSAEYPRRVIQELISRGETIASAESCTGGGISAVLTSIPGSSAAVWGGVVSYANEAKITMLDVDAGLLERDGAVSSGVAKSMAWGMRIRSGADWTVAVTGIAGPDGGTDEKPVGTVWIGWCNPHGAVTTRQYHFDGNRDEIRKRTVEEALAGLLELFSGVV